MASKQNLHHNNCSQKVTLFDHKWPYFHTRANYWPPSWNLAGWSLIFGTSQFSEVKKCHLCLNSNHIWKKHCQHNSSHYKFLLKNNNTHY